jgi:O-succinylbenzoic acid--CoA ligase
LGRIDNVINSGGIKIHPEKLEEIIGRIFSKLNEDKRFFITGLPHPELGEVASLIIEGKSWQEEKMAKVKASLIENLSRYEIPKNILFEDIFLETLSGKIDRIKIRQNRINKTPNNSI